MPLSPLGGQTHLLLPFTETHLCLFIRLVNALVAAYPMFIFGARFVFWQDWTAACKAQLVWAFFQSMTDRNPPIKNKTFALPAALFCGHVFQVFQNTALQVKHILDPLTQ
jgi:hypothetical protein